MKITTRLFIICGASPGLTKRAKFVEEQHLSREDPVTHEDASLFNGH